eukprot:SAG31_NODE_200_length_20519_cov_57.688833_8_plen_68_part_00
MSGRSTLISDVLPEEEIENRQLFIILDEMMDDKIKLKFANYTTRTGTKFEYELHNGLFWVVKKIKKK